MNISVDLLARKITAMKFGQNLKKLCSLAPNFLLISRNSVELSEDQDSKFTPQCFLSHYFSFQYLYWIAIIIGLL